MELGLAILAFVIASVGAGYHYIQEGLINCPDVNVLCLCEDKEFEALPNFSGDASITSWKEREILSNGIQCERHQEL